MKSGPKFNNIVRDFAPINSMGYDEVVNLLQEKTSPVITNVTSHVFYIAFIIWSMNDYKSRTEYKDRTNYDMDLYFKRQNFFFTAALLLNDIDLTGAAGSRYIRNYIINNKTDTFVYAPNYTDTLQTTMGYYRPGFEDLYILKSKDLEKKELKCSQVTVYGEELAKVLDDYIKNTEYYKKYRTSLEVPRNVLIDLGKIISLDMKNMPLLKKKITEVLFNNKYNDNFLKPLSLSKDLLLYTIKNHNCNIEENIRKIEFDFYSPRSLNYSLPDNLTHIAKTWEIILGRQYFTLGLSMIWKHALSLLNKPMTESEWMEIVKDEALKDLNPNETIKSLLLKTNYNYEERSELLKVGVSKIQSDLMVDGLKIVLSVYNRFNDRDDIGKDYDNMFGINDDMDTMPLYLFFNKINNHKDDKAIDYLLSLVKELIFQNKIIGYKKLLRGKNGYYYEYTNGYYHKICDYYYGYAGNRMVNIYNALIDLDLLGGANNE